MPSTSQEPSVATSCAQQWRRSWDEVMSACLPGLGSFEETLIATAEAVLGGAPTGVLDLGGGPGLLAERLATRWPRADVRLLDLDPVLLLLAQAAVPAGVSVHSGDLTTEHWPADVAGGAPIDLVSIVMTMHYLSEDQARALYRRALALLRPGGLLVVADLIPADDLPSVMSALRPVADEAAAGLAWTRWWERLRAEPIFGPWVRQRETLFADRSPAEFTPGEDWHRKAAREAGFREAGVIWRRGAHAAVCAVA